jgi:hypothetical protein
MRSEIKDSQAKWWNLSARLFVEVWVLFVRANQETKRLAKIAANSVLKEEGMSSSTSSSVVKV